jgi:hypothetical protein
MPDEHALAAFPYSVIRRLDEIDLHDSFIVAVQDAPQTIGKTFEKLIGFSLGPQNFDTTKGPDLHVCEDLDGIDVLRDGKYSLALNCQLSNPTGDGYFEPAVEPNGLSLSEDLWPTDIVQGHIGKYLPAAIFGWAEVNVGSDATYVAPKLNAGALVTGWARFGSASGTETIDVTAILYATRITS